MERRRLLLGSGAAFATVLAGCSDLMSDDSDGNDDGNGNDVKSSGSGGNGDGDSSFDGIPGFDHPDLDEYGVTIKYAEYDDSDVEIGVKLEKALDEYTESELYEHEEKLGKLAGDAIDNRDWVEENVHTITFTVYDKDDIKVLSIFVDVQWVLMYVDGEVALDELADEMETEKK